MVEQINVTVTVTKHPIIRMCKVVFDGGHHLVIGGRLVKAGLPEYRPEDFPIPVDKYIDGDDLVKVLVEADGKMRQVGAVRACQLLFHPLPAADVEAWIRREARK